MEDNVGKIKVLIVYSRDISEDDSGAARTTIGLANYLANNEKFKCYTNFRIIKGANSLINQVDCNSSVKISLKECIKNILPDIILVPEGYLLTAAVKNASKGLKSIIVSAMHNKPGYERIRLSIVLFESMQFNKSIFKRFRALIMLMSYPIFSFIYKKILYNRIRKAYISSDSFVLLSEKFFNEFRNAYNIKNINKLQAIENPLSFSEFADEKIIDNKKNILLVVSRLDEQQKQLSFILKAWKQLYVNNPNWELHIVGSGRSEMYYKKLSLKWRLNRISFFGMQPPKEFYIRSSIFLMSSAYEGWGITLTEAQQFGCVPVAMNSFSSLSDIISNGQNGIITLENNLACFITAIDELMNNQKKRRDMAIKAVESSKKFKPDIVYAKWVDLFNKLINERNN